MKTNKTWMRFIRCLTLLSGFLLIFKSMTAEAVENDYLRSLNVGVAKVLDADITTMKREEVKLASKSSERTIEEKKMSTLVMANVKNTLNVRLEPEEDSKVVGKLYKDCGGTILESSNGWTKLQSGNVIGWCNNEFLVFNEEAEEMAKDVGMLTAVVNTDGLRVRKEASSDGVLYGILSEGEKVNVIDELGDWISVNYGGDEAFVSAEYVTVEFNIDSGETVEEIKKREDEEAAKKAKLVTNYGALPADTSDVELLGALIYCEAGNQSYEGKLAVGAVVMNRLRCPAYPNTIGSVIYASGQFTPAGSGRVAKVLEKGVPQQCLEAAQAAINGETNVGSAMHFRRAGKREGTVIGDHVFW